MTGPQPPTPAIINQMDRTFYKLDIGGIVYLVDPVTTTAYTYDLADPTPVGTIHWTDPTAAPQLKYDADWQERLTAKRAQQQ